MESYTDTSYSITTNDYSLIISYVNPTGELDKTTYLPLDNLNTQIKNSDLYYIHGSNNKILLNYNYCTDPSGSDINEHIGLVWDIIHTRRNNVSISKKIFTNSFGGQQVAELTPNINIKGIYDRVNSNQLDTYTVSGGTVTNSDGLYNITNSTTAGSISSLYTKRIINYQAGTSTLTRFTAIFDTPVANSEQLAGIGADGNGLYFGYNGENFGVLRKTAGVNHVVNLTLSGNESSGVNVTITLNSVDYDISLSSGTNDFNISEVIGETFSGWNIESYDGEIYFTSTTTGPLSGTYTYSSAGSTTGVFSTTITGVDDTDSWILQSSWNGDTLDGSGDSGMTLDTTKGNLYQIRYQWLGFGKMEFYIEDQTDGNWINVHTIYYTNQYTSVNVRIPSLKPTYRVESISSTTSLTLKIASIAMFMEGKQNLEVNNYAYQSEKTISASTDTNILTIKNKAHINGIQNNSEIRIRSFSFASDGNKIAHFHIYKNATNGDGSSSDFPIYNSVNSNSVISYDTNSTSISGGTLVFAGVLGKTDSKIVMAEHLYLNNLESLTIIANSSGGSDIGVSIDWFEVI